MKPDFDLSGRLALVTGSTRGLGWAMVQALAAAGAGIILQGRNDDALGHCAQVLREAGTPAVDTLRFDVTDASERDVRCIR
jgi:gluconate 5-dehydrogenase